MPVLQLARSYWAPTRQATTIHRPCPTIAGNRCHGIFPPYDIFSPGTSDPRIRPPPGLAALNLRVLRSGLSTRYKTKRPKILLWSYSQVLWWLTVQQSDALWRKIHNAKKDGLESQCDEVTQPASWRRFQGPPNVLASAWNKACS